LSPGLINAKEVILVGKEVYVDIPSCLWMWGAVGVVAGVGIAYDFGWPFVIKLAHFLDVLKKPEVFLMAFVDLFVFTFLALQMSSVEGDVYKHLYDVLRVFSLSANDFELAKLTWGESWALLIMIWLDALFMITAFLSLAAERMVRSVLAIGIPKDRKHVIIFGLGTWGLHYAKALASSGIDVVVIEKDSSDAAVKEVVETWVGENYNGKRIHLIDGDCFDNKTLEKAQIANANKILPLLKGDGANIDAAYRVRKYFSDNRGQQRGQVVLLPVDNIRLSTSLATYKRFSDHNGEIEIRFFNIMQQAAVRHLINHPPELYADIFGQKQIHFAIYGLGDVAINLIYVIGQLCHYRTWDIDSGDARNEVKKVRVSIVDQDIDKTEQEIKYLFPNLREVLDIYIIPSAISNGSAANDYFLPTGNQLQGDKTFVPPVTQHFFCFKDETLSVRCAVKLRRQQMKQSSLNTPIFVRSHDGKGLARLIESNCDKAEWPDNIFPYIILSGKLDEDIYFSECIERVAKAFNDWKCEDGETIEEKNLNEQWGNISSDFRHSSFFQAAYLGIRLRSVGYDWIKDELATGQDEWVKDSASIVHLALLEHQRYKAERWMLGWSHGERTLDDIARSHNELESLSSNMNWGDGYDMDQARQLPSYLKEAGCRVEKVESVGVIKPSGKLNINKKEHILFNLLDARARGKIKALLGDDKEMSKQITGLLPLPFDVIKAILPLVWNVSELRSLGKEIKLKSEQEIESEFEHIDRLLDCIKPAGSENDKDISEQSVIEDIPKQSVIKDISEISGKIAMYIEMPLQQSFDQWKANDLQVLDYLCDACIATDNYIRCRSDKVIGVSSKLEDIGVSTSFLPKPGIKEKADDQG